VTKYGEGITSKYCSKRAERITFKYVPKYKRVVGEQPIIHRYKKVVPLFEKMVEKGDLKDAFKNSDLGELTIATVHNYDEKPLFERSLDFLGVSDYVVLKHSGEWSMFHKYKYLLEFVNSGKCRKYLLFCDARDTIFVDDPAKILPFFKEFNCEMLFNATMSARGVFKAYRSALPLYWWYRKISKTGGMRKYPNAGVFIGKSSFMVGFFENILRYETNRMYEMDQDILRLVFPWYWPRMQVDYYNKITYRN